MSDAEPSAGSAVGGDPPAEALDRARAAADGLGASLQGRLFSALEEGGPLQAVTVCSVEAQAITTAHSIDGLSVRRVSFLTRNASNEPDAYETARLRAMAVQHEAGASLEGFTEVVDEVDGRTLRLTRPILVAPPCLTCHGPAEDIDPAVLELIRNQYPEDRAVGYAVGDLRGAISVRLGLDPDR